MFFQEFSLVLSIKANPSVFSFCLIPSVPMKLGETVACLGLEGLSLCGNFPVQSLCVWLLGGRVRFQVSTGHVFPSCDGSSLTLVEGDAGDERGLEPEPGVS